jgi:hypothetical protein
MPIDRIDVQLLTRCRFPRKSRFPEPKSGDWFDLPLAGRMAVRRADVFGGTDKEMAKSLSVLLAREIIREGIDVVICTHFHADPVNGLLMADGTPAFPHAGRSVNTPSVSRYGWRSV